MTVRGLVRRAIVAGPRVMGPTRFERFSGGPDGTLSCYCTLAEELGRVGPQLLTAELGRVWSYRLRWP